MEYRKTENDNGAVALDACVSLTLFMFLILLVYSLFFVFQAQQKIANAMIESGQSLSLDSYYGEKLMNTKSLTDDVALLISDLFGFSSKDPYYVSDSTWYKDKDIQQAVKKRFIAYFSNGKEAEADRRLKALNVKNGLSGLDFSESKIEDGKIYITVKYKLKYEFNAFGWEELEFKQTSCSKMWGL